MLTLTRVLARTLRNACRKALDLRANSPIHRIHFEAGASGLIARAQGHEAAIQYYEPGTFPAASLDIPIHLLKEIEGSRPDPVQIEQSKNRLTANWYERAVPRAFSVESSDNPNPLEFPAEPENWTDVEPTIVQAFADAMRSTDEASSRYALGCVQLRGKEGSITATDGRHLLKQTGFVFPFEDELLVRPNKLFGSKEFLPGERVEIGKTDTHVVFRTGPWTLYLSVAKDGRFPRVDDVIPRYSDAPTVVELSREDRDFLIANLQSLPVHDETYREITLDVNGKVAIRAKQGEDAPTELVLCRSRKTGSDTVLASNRIYLQRAAQLGLTHLYLFGQDRPVLAKDARRTLVWMLLDKECIVPASADSKQVLSDPAFVSPSPPSIPMHKRKNTLPPSQAHQNVSTSAPIDDAATSATPVTASPLDQAIRLRSSLQDALDASNALVRCIKRQKKHDRAYKAAIASLRQLQAVA
jgi:hypothetical protein